MDVSVPIYMSGGAFGNLFFFMVAFALERCSARYDRRVINYMVAHAFHV